MFKKLLQTDASMAPALLRISLALIVLPHGWHKIGSGYAGFYQYTTGVLHLPGIFPFLTAVIETLGCAMLLTGAFTRPWVVALFVQFVAFITVEHWQYGFFMNWAGTNKGEGFEFHLLILAVSAALALTGGGKWSIDGWWSQRIGRLTD